MALKAKYLKKEDIPSGQEGLYVEKGGVWVLDLENIREHPDAEALKKALDTERDDKDKLDKKLKMYEGLGLTPDQIKALDADAAKLREEQAKASGNLEAVLAERVGNLKKAHDKELADLRALYDSANSQLRDLVVKDAVSKAALAAGVRSEALDDVALHAERLFTVEGGKPIPKSPDGKVIYGKNGTDPMPVSEWIESMVKTKPHWLGETSGSGSGGSDQRSSVPNGGRFISPADLGANLEDVASGKKEVKV